MRSIAILCLSLCSCAAALKPPEGFVPIDPCGYDLAAVAADGSKMFVSREPDQPRTDASFWKEVVERHLQSRGYGKVGEGESREIPGPRRPGWVMEFATSASGGAYRYLVAVLTQGTTIHTIEFGCEEAAYARHRDAVHSFIRRYAGGK